MTANVMNTSATFPADFAGRVVLITGAARGLGRAAAERFHARGASVVVHARDITRALVVASALGDGALAVDGDLTQDGAADDLVRRTIDRFGRIDVLVNNAASAAS